MKDTSIEVEQKFRELIMARSAGERMIMGASMFDAARAMILASLPENVSEEERRQALMERIYGIRPAQYLAEGITK
jgi:hypothetical protein